jgi:hypothetical protein
MRNRFAVLVALMAAPLATVAAQDAAPRNVISIQPLSAMFTVFSGEFERGLTKAVSWGVGGTYFSIGDTGDEASYTSGDFKLRYYPQGAALNGFSLGGTVGYSNVSETVGASNSSQGAPAIGLLLEYQWLMGSKKSFSMAMGAGAKAVMLNEDDFTGNEVTARYPTARVSIGYAW